MPDRNDQGPYDNRYPKGYNVPPLMGNDQLPPPKGVWREPVETVVSRLKGNGR